MVTLTFCPLESSTSSTTSSVGICCVSWREKQDWHPSPLPQTEGPRPPTALPPHLLGLAQEAVEGLAASQCWVLPYCRKGHEESGVPWEGAGTHISAWSFCSPSVCPQTVCWGSQGPPCTSPLCQCRAGAGTGAGIQGTSPPNASTRLGVARWATVNGAVQGGSHGQCPSALHNQAGAGPAYQPACTSPAAPVAALPPLG